MNEQRPLCFFVLFFYWLVIDASRLRGCVGLVGRAGGIKVLLGGRIGASRGECESSFLSF